MARIRTIKPEFWTDEVTGQFSLLAKCLFLGLLNIADDYGVLEYRPAEWRIKILPYDSCTTHGALLRAFEEELIRSGRVRTFTLGEPTGEPRRYVLIANFAKHQVVNRPSKPLLEGWEKGDTPARYAQRLGYLLETTPTPLTEDSVSPPAPLIAGKEGKGKEGNGRERNDVARTREGWSPPPPGRPAPPASDLHREVRAYIVTRLPNLAARASPEIDEWIAEGCDPAQDIYPCVDGLVEQRRGDIGSFRYFTRSILTARAERREREEQWKRMEEKFK